MFQAIRNLIRLQQIARILVRHGLGPLLERIPPVRLLFWIWRLNPFRKKTTTTMGVRLRLVMEELGPTFIKFGQALSTRMDLLPDEVGVEIKKLQDEVAPFPFETVQETIESALGGPLEEFFPTFEKEPVASASIAQVHRAATRDGRIVAVKVIRPNIQKVVEADIGVLYTIAGFIEDNISEWRRFRSRRVVDEFAFSIRKEMDFLVEAQRMKKIHRNFDKDPILHIPEVIDSLSTPSVLTMSWVDGVPIDELHLHPHLNIDVVKASENAVKIFFMQVFRDGYFHADLHPGNLFVQSDGTIATVDFGIVGQLSLQTRLWIAEMMQGFLTRDYAKVARVHLEAGYIPPDTNMAEFEEACRQIGEPVFDLPLKEISIGRLLGQLFKTTEEFQMQVQPQLLLLQKTMLVVEGVGRQLNPDLNVWMVAEPLIRDWIIEHLGPKGRLKTARKNLESYGHQMIDMPGLAHAAMKRLAEDRITLGIHADSLKGLEDRISTTSRRLNATLAGGALFIGATVMLTNGLSHWWYAPPFFFSFLFFLGGMRSTR